MNGRVTSLVHKDPLFLTTTAPPSSISDSPLHVAALLGQIEFTKELLSQNPELTAKLNPHGSSALHLASAKGYVDIVIQLLFVNPDMCSVLDRDGCSPLHLAAIKGRVGVLTELVRVRPESTRVLTRGGGETCMHLCVKYNHVEALKVLVEDVKNDEFVNWKDCDGNTILHIAVSKKQIEIIKFLIANTAIEVNTRNANGFTALEVLSQSPRDLRDMEIKECILYGRTRRIEHIPSFIPNEDEDIDTVQKSPFSITDPIPKHQPRKPKHIDWLGRKRSALMIVASLIATVAFQAGISPPGGVWQDGNSSGNSTGNPGEKQHTMGKSVMAYNIPRGYGQFMIFNTIAFLASLSIILLQISGLPLKKRRWMWSQMVTMWIAICSQTITYFITLIHMTPKHVEGTLFNVTRISVLTWLCMMGLVFVGNVIRVVFWLLRKYGYVKEKEREPLIYREDDENDDL